jgi:hypothetical protein
MGSVLIVASCLPLLKNKIRLNYFSSRRFRKSFESDETWYKVNQFDARKMLLASMGLDASLRREAVLLGVKKNRQKKFDYGKGDILKTDDDMCARIK